MSYHQGRVITLEELTKSVEKIGTLPSMFQMGEPVAFHMRESLLLETVPGTIVGVNFTPAGEAYDIGFQITGTELYIVIENVIGYLSKLSHVAPPAAPVPETPPARTGLMLVKK